jgi:hypothetical protein
MRLTAPEFNTSEKIQAYDRHQIPDASVLFILKLNMELLFDVFSNNLTVEEVNNTMCIICIVR